MKVLSITAQKPNSTGSGVFLTELVNNFEKKGHEQEVICAAYESDLINVSKNAVCNIKPQCKNQFHEPHYNYILFNTKSLPIKIAGMSDVMPYESIKYSDLAKNEKALTLWQKVFRNKIEEVINKFKPELIICHHLYLLTAIVVDIVKSNDVLKVGSKQPYLYGICHNTDLRQYQQTNLKREFIKKNINKLDKIFFPSEEHKNKAIELFDLINIKTEVIGIGYNNTIFKPIDTCERNELNKHKLLYVGKVSKKKGVLSLVKAINILNDEKISLDIIGGAGDKIEYDEILAESKKSKSEIKILNFVNQAELVKHYNSHEIFILASFSEGIPIVPLEAMACGCKVVISDLPGVKKFYEANIKNASIKYVKLPKLSNVDDASEIELDLFEKRLAEKIRESIEDKRKYLPNLSDISWESIANKILI